MSDRVICRAITEVDFAAIATLLTRGFPRRNLQFWLRALETMKTLNHPRDLPSYGYLLQADNDVVGVILFLWSRATGGSGFRCNLSSWYVEPRFRTYASLFASRAFHFKDITYLNVSPKSTTLPIIESQGFSRYCDGNVLAVPMLNGTRGPSAEVFCVPHRPEVELDTRDEELLLHHAAHGCMSVWCATSKQAFPFIFRPRRVKRIIPCAQMIYCRDIAEFVRFAGPIGRFLAFRGRPFVLIDANAPIPGLIGGVFSRNWMPPKYFKGPERPRLGDLTYTEFGLLGV